MKRRGKRRCRTSLLTATILTSDHDVIKAHKKPLYVGFIHEQHYRVCIFVLYNVFFCVD